MAKVGIVMGSDSDLPVMSKAADVLKKLGVDFHTFMKWVRGSGEMTAGVTE